jgi:ATP-binding cassette, subfamily B, bacterial
VSETPHPGLTPVSMFHRLSAAYSTAWRSAPAATSGQVTLSVASGLVPVGVAWLTRGLLNDLSHRPVAYGHLIGLAVMLAVLGGMMTIGPQLSQRIQAELDRRVRLMTQDRLYGAVNRFVGLERFENPAFLDRLQLAQQAGAVAPQVIGGGLGSLQICITLVGFVTALVALSPFMAAVVVLAGVPALFAELALSRSRGDVLWKTTPAVRRQLFYSKLLTDGIAAKEVRIFGLGSFLQRRMLTELRQVNDAQRALDRRVVRTQLVLAALGAVVSGAGLIWAVGKVGAGKLTLGDLSMFVAAVAGTQSGLAAQVRNVATIHQGLLRFGHYLDVLAAGPDLPELPQPRPLPRLSESIELRDVWFRYDDEKPWILQGVDLTIPCGGSLAIVGANGAGKSTLIKLLCRFYDPIRGQILWNGVDIRHVGAAALRERVGVVFQDYMAYDLTAAENIGVGDLDLLEDREQIKAAAQLAEVHDCLTGLPHGYDTMLSRMFFMNAKLDDPEAGVILSGGQWQRVALARGLVRNDRELLILDEPSAGLDAKSEHAVHRRLVRYRAETTSILISHRLNAVRHADLIAVLSGGRIRELGTHDRLMADGGEYAELFALQASGYGSEPAPDGEVVVGESS